MTHQAAMTATAEAALGWPARSSSQTESSATSTRTKLHQEAGPNRGHDRGDGNKDGADEAHTTEGAAVRG